MTRQSGALNERDRAMLRATLAFPFPTHFRGSRAAGLGTGGGLMGESGAAETFWERFLATYRFRRNFGRESWWRSFWGAIRAAWGDGPNS